MVGFFGCLMTAFPIAMLIIIPHDGWGPYLPSNRYTKMANEIHRLKQKLFEAEVENKLLHEMLQDKG
jgi:hypothetical protein